ncbi:MAG: RHS repeat-associated core domain-containing protein [Spirochaetes bacterium]|nr:RHS repeat-associated core domain-containing protein [Spirochaetota bacterium]
MLRETSIYESNNTVEGLPPTKHIFVGTTRIVSKLSHQDLGFIDNEYAKNNTFYIHQDHLGSSNIISDRDGNEYEHLLFCPYGETWAEEGEEQVLGKITYKFTSKELDEETNLYYFGARYFDAQVSRWMSCDPAFGEYLPSPRGNNSNLPGLGGVFNPVNLNVYCYAGNNPIKYVDPDGEKQNIAQKVFSGILKFAVSKSAKNELPRSKLTRYQNQNSQRSSSLCIWLYSACVP